ERQTVAGCRTGLDVQGLGANRDHFSVGLLDGVVRAGPGPVLHAGGGRDGHVITIARGRDGEGLGAGGLPQGDSGAVLGEGTRATGLDQPLVLVEVDVEVVEHLHVAARVSAEGVVVDVDQDTAQDVAVLVRVAVFEDVAVDDVRYA